MLFFFNVLLQNGAYNLGKTQKKYYVVIRGFKPGIYDKWYGDNGAEIQVRGFSKPVYKGFRTLKEAEAWKKTFEGKNSSVIQHPILTTTTLQVKDSHIEDEKPNLVIYTDGGALGNPGPGGYAAIIIKDEEVREFSGGYRLTTNNRMELMACIRALENLEQNSSIVLHSDSKYVVDAINKGWAERWRANNWMRNKAAPAKNADLWQRLLGLCKQHHIQFKWVKGHANNEGNERCDQLVKIVAKSTGLPTDDIFEKEYYGAAK